MSHLLVAPRITQLALTGRECQDIVTRFKGSMVERRRREFNEHGVTKFWGRDPRTNNVIHITIRSTRLDNPAGK